ncbi:MAG: sigma-54-dependent transcriptional regulator [Pyrinomonadaceae bacterium]
MKHGRDARATAVAGGLKKVIVRGHIRILVVDDDPLMADGLRRNLIDEGYQVDTAASSAEAIVRFESGLYPLVISDLQLPDIDGIELLRRIKETQPKTEIIVITAFGTLSNAIEATKAGAFYFLQKPFDFESLLPLINKALELQELVTETEDMRRRLADRTSYFNIIGASRDMQRIYEMIESVSKSDANVLIVGESGTGKELFANAIHYNSLRAKKSFIKVNCAALPKELIESELFGHIKGSFTGAHSDKDGLVQHAAGGSILLDEIAEMPVDVQPKLLRVLQERSYRKIGSEKTIEVDFRLITSTNRLPTDAIRDGQLRDDLFYRISTITIHVPPLRDRTDDVQLLTEHFLQIYAEKYGRHMTGVSQAAYRRLFNHTWPGNVRELQNVIERAVLLGKTSRIEPTDLPFDRDPHAETNGRGSGWDIPPNITLEEIEKQVIQRTLQRTNGNKQATASILGIYRARLYNKIKKYRIDIDSLFKEE